MIRLTSVYKEYPRSGTALRDVTLHVNKGELVFLTGHSGAGKSTILRLIQMADLPSAGEVRVSGFSSKLMRRRDIPQLRRKLGVVFQDFRLLRDRTAEENVAFALEVTGVKRTAIGQRVNRVLTQVGLSHKAQSFPDELSGGERQRVAIARALLKLFGGAAILALDEATSQLDNETEAALKRSLREAASGKGVIIVAHRLSSIRSADRIIVLERGKVVEEGTHKKLLSRKGLYASLWRLQNEDPLGGAGSLEVRISK